MTFFSHIYLHLHAFTYIFDYLRLSDIIIVLYKLTWTE